MVVKVNRIYDSAQIELLKEVDIFNISLEKKPSELDSNALTINNASKIRRDFPNISLSIFFNNYSGFSVDEKNEILEQLGADYYECSAPDFLKKTEYNIFIEHLKQIHLPKIVSGFFITKDDNYLLKEYNNLKRLIDENVKFIQVDVESIITPAFKLSKKDLSALEALFSEIPALFSDAFIQEVFTLVSNSKGIFMNLKSRRKDFYNSSGFDPSYYTNVSSTKCFPLREVKKIAETYSSKAGN